MPLIWDVRRKVVRESGKEGQTKPISITRNKSRESQNRRARKDGREAR